MADIYQEIWNADQQGNGVEAILDTQAGNAAHGFARVNSALDGADPDLRVITEAVIPERKRGTYDLCKRLFDNFALAEPMRETETPDEREEVHALVQAMVDTPPMDVARAFVARETGTEVTRERWHSTLVEMWFRRFAMNGDPELSGFEHVVVGEQQGSKVQGYHFWWKYFLDDGFARQIDPPGEMFPGLADDRIVYLGSRLSAGQHQFPESVTISYRWHAPDYDANAVRPLSKPIGGFFVGCSVEGLLALGTVRAHQGARAPKIAVIEGARYDLKLFRSPEGNQVRTFYPMFKGAADPADGGGRGTGTGGGTSSGTGSGTGTVPATPAGEVRIIAAMVNPEGDDPGFETVTLVNAGPAAASLTDWRIADRNGNAHTLGDTRLAPGAFLAVRLSGFDAQLSNKGGDIALVSPAGAVAHRVSYSKAQAARQGATVLF